jgi:DNA-binding NarL/FixJ family response regulator
VTELADAALRTRAVEVDSAEHSPFELWLLWAHLCSGTWRAVGAFSTESRLYVVVRTVPLPRRCPQKAVATAETVLRGHPSKVVAAELGVTDSTVSCAVRLVLDRMGFDCPVRGAPIILCLAAGGHGVIGRVAELDAGARVVSVERPAAALVCLTEVERQVLAAVLDGKTHAEVAAKRGRSVRTIRNETLSAFMKLGVSNLTEVRALLIAAQPKAA